MASKPDENKDGAIEAPADVDDEGFGAAFAERSAPEAEEPGEGDKPAAVEDKSPDAAQPASEAPAAKPEQSPAPQADPWSGKTPEQLVEEIKRLQQSDQSQRGRVAALQRKIDASARTPAPQREERAEGDNQPEPKPASKSRADLEARVNAAAEEYPDVAGPLKDLIDDLRTEMTETAAKVAPITEEKEAADFTRYYASLEAKHSDFREIIADDSFKAWVGDQPKPIQELANGWDATGGSQVLTLYKAERAAAMATTGKEPDPEPKPDTNAERRARQLEGSRSVRTRGAPVASGVPDDFGAAFDARAAKPLA